LAIGVQAVLTAQGRVIAQSSRHPFTVNTAVFVTPALLADIVALVWDVTFDVFTVNFADVEFAEMTTDAGTAAEAELLESFTVKPPAGATLLIVTVPVDVPPLVTLVGLRVNEVNTGALIASVAVRVIAPEFAVIVAATEVATAVVFTVNVADVAFAATVTEAGSVADAVVLDRATFTPPDGAGPVKVTVPAEEVPPATLVGFTLTDANTGGLIVSVTVTTTAPKVALTVAATVATTGVVFTVNVADEVPASTFTDVGNAADVELLDSDTVTPAAGAGPFKVTVPIEGVPPVTVDGFKPID